MATKKVWQIGTEEIMSWYDNYTEYYDTCTFSISQGNDLIGSSASEDFDKNREILMQTLTYAERVNNTDILTLRLYKMKGDESDITKKTPCVATTFVRVCAMDTTSKDDAKSEYRMRQDTMLELLQRMDARLAALEASPDEDEEDEDSSVMGTIGGLLKDPTIKTALIGMVLGKLGLAAPPLPSSAPVPPALPRMSAVAGVERPTEAAIDRDAPTPGAAQMEIANRVNAALRILADGNPDLPGDLERLAKMKLEAPDSYAMVLGMLRKM